MADEIFFQTDYVIISWDAKLKAVFSIWSGYVGGGEDKVQIGYQKISELLAQKEGHKWLSDISALRVVDQDDQKWINDEGHLLLVKAGLRYIAMLAPQSPTAKSSVNRVASKMAGSEIELAAFADLDEARTWLNEQTS